MNRTITSFSVALFLNTFAACGEGDTGTETDNGTTDTSTSTDTDTTSTGDVDTTDEPTTGSSTGTPLGPILTVKVNIQQGSFQVMEGDEQLIVMEGAHDCPLSNGYYTCQVTDLEPNGYKVEFLDVAGYKTPNSFLVQLDGQNDVVVGDYVPAP